MKETVLEGGVYSPGEAITLDIQEREFYEVNGYLVKHLFDSEECDEILDKLRPYENKDRDTMLNVDRMYVISKYFDEMYAEKHNITPKEVPIDQVPFQDIEETARLVRVFAEDLRPASVVKQLYEGELGKGKKFKWGRLMNQFAVKEPGTPSADVAWNPHQDNSYAKSPNNLYVSVMTFFEDADKENGTMYVYPESYKQGPIKHENVPSFRGSNKKNPGNIAQIPEGFEPLDLIVKKGDVLFLHGGTIHGSHPNVSLTKSRPAIVNVYIPEGEVYRPGGPSQKMFMPLN